MQHTWKGFRLVVTLKGGGGSSPWSREGGARKGDGAFQTVRGLQRDCIEVQVPLLPSALVSLGTTAVHSFRHRS